MSSSARANEHYEPNSEMDGPMYERRCTLSTSRAYAVAAIRQTRDIVRVFFTKGNGTSIYKVYLSPLRSSARRLRSCSSVNHEQIIQCAYVGIDTNGPLDGSLDVKVVFP